VTSSEGKTDEFRIATNAPFNAFAEGDEAPTEEDNGGEDSLKPNRPSRRLSRPWVATLLFALG
jgi:hypothetical protein